jgi:hypothetical protein
MIENPADLGAECLGFLGSDFQTRESREIGDVNHVMG